jgi:hypothetical protein
MSEYDTPVRSPVSSGTRVRNHPGPGSGQTPPLSPGARSHPSARSDQSGAGQPPAPPGPPASAQDRRVSRHSEFEPRGGETKITGLEED